MKKGEKVERAAREKRIAAPEETAGLKFRESHQISQYRDLLEELQDAPKGSTLKISKQARYTAVKHIRNLGLKVLWARGKGDDLYIKIVGEVAQPLTVERVVKEAVAARIGKNGGAKGNGTVQRLILGEMAKGPMTLREVAGLTGQTKIGTAEMLTQMAADRLIECEDGAYRALNGAE